MKLPHVRRIIVDEAHQVLTAASWRDFGWMDQLALLPIQKVFLTATLSRSDFVPWTKALGLPLTIPTTRAPTCRPELQYSVVKLSPQESVEDHVRHLAKAIPSKHPTWDSARSRGIIYCASVAQVKALSKRLCCPMYHSEMTSKEKQKAKDTWSAGATEASKWMVATSAFIHGIDEPFVAAVLFAGSPYSFYDFLQASSRGGRRGLPCLVILFDTGEDYLANTKKTWSPIETQHWRDMQDWILDDTQCRRLFISHHMDDSLQTCGDLPGAQPCDFCHPDRTLLALIYPKSDDTPMLVDDPTPAQAKAPAVVPMDTSSDGGEDEYGDKDFWLALDEDTLASLPDLSPNTSSLPSSSRGSSTAVSRNMSSSSSVALSSSSSSLCSAGQPFFFLPFIVFPILTHTAT